MCFDEQVIAPSYPRDNVLSLMCFHGPVEDEEDLERLVDDLVLGAFGRLINSAVTIPTPAIQNDTGNLKTETE